MSEEFRTNLVARAQLAVDYADKIQSEAGAQNSLVVPFFEVLGYDMHDPTEVVPEAQTSFGGKMNSRVDYAIHKDGKPAIAVECKMVGSLKESHIQELKGYFNAFPDIKLGILTDGLVYKLFSDVTKEPYMDDEPFAVVDLSEVAEEQIPEDAFDALLKIRKEEFDPDDVGADAQRRIYVAAYLDALEENFEEPSNDVTRVFMDKAGVEGNKVAKLVNEHADLLREAMSTFLDRKLLERVGFVDRDLVRVPPRDEKEEHAGVHDGDSDGSQQQAEPDIVTTAAEIRVFQYVKNRLPFLIERDEELFQRINDIQMKDRKHICNISYKMEQKGKLFGLREKKSPKYRFEFADGDIIETNDLSDIDDKLLAHFLQRVEEMG